MRVLREYVAAAGIGLELALGAAPLLLLTGMFRWLLDAPRAFVFAAPGAYLLLAAVLASYWPRGESGFGPANRITLARGALVCVVAAGMASPSWLTQQAQWLVLVAALALLLDGLDGWVARRTGTESAFGARFDMELDAALILVLCLCVVLTAKAGVWALAIGGMRYAFVAAMQPWPWLASPLPESRRRKAVCVWQVGSLLAALWPGVPPVLVTLALGIALVMLTWSFAVDVWWLRRSARVVPTGG